MIDEYSELDDKELIRKLEDAKLATRLVNSPEWRLLKEAGKRIVDKAIDQFALSTEADNILAIAELKIVIRKYKYGLFNEVEQLAQEGEMIFEEARERDVIMKEIHGERNKD